MATISYKCPNCGGGLQFNPAKQNYQCEFCMSDFSQQQLAELQPDVQPEQIVSDLGGEGKSQHQNQALLYSCPSCGAEIVTDETTAATFCFYCHNPVVLSGRLSGEYLPDCVVPFAIDREQAVKAFTDWIKKKRFLPSEFFTEKQIEKLSGVYFPYWLYSCHVDGSLDAQGTRIRTWTTGNIRYTETEKYDIKREGSMKINHVTRNALKKADKQLVEGVLPFQMQDMKPFTMGYLSGFMAEKRDMNQQQFCQEVEDEVRDFAISSLKNSAGSYNTISVMKNKAEIKNPDWKYALLPVWTLTYRDQQKDKIYYYAFNGQTGKVCGELPVDKKKLSIHFISIFVPMLFLLLLAGYFI